VRTLSEKVVTLGKMERRNFVGRHAVDRAGDRLSAEPRGVDNQRGRESHRLGAAGLYFHAATDDAAADEWGPERNRRAAS
jgi:hypothetical protein